MSVKIMKKSFVTFTIVLCAYAGNLMASEYMSADEVRALIIGKTFDGHYLPKDKRFSVYESPDGEHKVYYPGKDKRSKNRKWFVNDKGQHCTTHKKWSEPRCSYVKNIGNGKYHKINSDGEHTHTLTNFREGNHL